MDGRCYSARAMGNAIKAQSKKLQICLSFDTLSFRHKWHCRFRYWIEIGVFDRIEKTLQSQAIAIKGIKSLALDSTYIKVHPDGTGAPKKKDRNPSARVVAD